MIFGQSDGRQPSYNVRLSPPGAAGSPPAPQGAVETQFIVDSEPVGNPSDSGQLAPTARRLPPPLGVRPRASDPAAEGPADAGYSSANDAIACEALGFPTGSRSLNRPRRGRGNRWKPSASRGRLTIWSLSRSSAADAAADPRQAVEIPDVGGMHHEAERQAERVGEQMALAAIDRQ